MDVETILLSRSNGRFDGILEELKNQKTYFDLLVDTRKEINEAGEEVENVVVLHYLKVTTQYTHEEIEKIENLTGQPFDEPNTGEPAIELLKSPLNGDFGLGPICFRGAKDRGKKSKAEILEIQKAFVAMDIVFTQQELDALSEAFTHAKITGMTETVDEETGQTYKTYQREYSESQEFFERYDEIKKEHDHFDEVAAKIAVKLNLNAFNAERTPPFFKNLRDRLKNNFSIKTVRDCARISGAALKLFDDSEKFGLIRQNAQINEIARATNKDIVYADDFTKGIIKNKKLVAEITDYSKLQGKLDTNTAKMLFLILRRAEENNMRSEVVTMTLAEYMDARGLKDKKSARESARKAIDVLSHVRYQDEKTGDFVNLADSGKYERGAIHFRFGTTFFQILKICKPMPIAKIIFKTNDHRNPYAFKLFGKLSEVKNLNIGKPNEDIHSVRSLLESLHDMPTYEEVMATDRHYQKRIIEPFERDMDLLVEEGLLKWHYCHKGGALITETEAETFDYETFINCNVKIEWIDYPNEKIRREARDEEMQEARERKKKATKKAKQEAANKKAKKELEQKENR